MLIRGCITVSAILALAAPALAQRVPFTRTFDVGTAPALEVTTSRGKIMSGPALRAGSS